MGLQPRSPTVAASTTYGCSLDHLRLQVRTAFQSSQGALMRTILFSSQRATGNTKEVLVLTLFLLTLTLTLTPHPNP